MSHCMSHTVCGIPPPQIVSQGDCAVTPIDNWHLTTWYKYPELLAQRCHGRRCRCRNASAPVLANGNGPFIGVDTDADDGDCITGTPEKAIGLFVIVSDSIEDADGDADVGISEGLSGSAVPSSVGTEPIEGV